MAEGPQLDADRTLALTYVPAARRPALEALWRLDVAMGAVLAGGREPLISQIKLAWWRDSLEKLDREKPPAEPVLEAVGQLVLPAGIRGDELSAMEEGWTVLLSQESLSSSELDRYAAARGALLFRFSARLLGGESSPQIERSGEGWALLDLARHSNAKDAQAALLAARGGSQARFRWPASLRPLGMLAALARRDAERDVSELEPHGAPKRMLRMLRHRLTGR